MRRFSALALAAALLGAGCASGIHLGGVYRPQRHGESSSGRNELLVEDTPWDFFWGLISPGDTNVHDDLRHMMQSDEYLTDIDIEERTTLLGAVVWFVTAGFLNQHTLEVYGRREIQSEPAPSLETPENRTPY